MDREWREVKRKIGVLVQSHKKSLLLMCQMGEWHRSSVTPSTSSFSMTVTTIPGQHRGRCARATVTLPLLLSYMSSPQHTVVCHWKSCSCTVYTFHQNLTLEHTVSTVLPLSYLDKKFDIRVSVLTVSGHDACFWLSPGFLRCFFNYSPLLIFGGLHPLEKDEKKKQQISSLRLSSLHWQGSP